jgi:Flp pilus assembly protein TadD
MGINIRCMMETMWRGTAPGARVAAMRAPFRNALLGVLAAATLTALAGGAFLLHAPAMPEAAEAGLAGSGAAPAAGTAPGDAALPLPPEPPRLAESAEYEACLGQLRADPEGALARASDWEEKGGGDPARHCLALGLLALGEPERAAPRLERLAGTSDAGTPARAAIYAQAAQAWMMAGDNARAYGATTLALSLTPNDTALLVDRAIAAGAMGRYGEALQDLDHAIATEASRTEAWVFRAAALRNLDRAEDAMRDIQQALTLDPRNPEALLERGILRQLKGDTRGAREDWERTVALAPDSAAADLAMQNLALNEAGPRRR